MLHSVCCYEHHESGESHTEEHMPQRIHTIHHHHIQKQTIIKKIEVPVIKEIKVPYYVYEPFKVPYHYMVKPYIVKVPIEYYKEEKHEDVHHGDDEGHGEGGDSDGHEEHYEESEGGEGESHGEEHKE